MKGYKLDIIDFLTANEIVVSKREARRLIVQRGIHILHDGAEYDVIDEIIHLPLDWHPVVVRIGKRKFFRIVLPEGE